MSTHSLPCGPVLTVRRLGVDLSHGFSRLCNALSMSFPVGEQFFIDAVREGARHLSDSPEHQTLRETVRGFIGQEATHRHLHGLYNAHLEKQGLINHWGPRAARRLETGRRKMFSTSEKGHLHELAITAAYEHFTAVFGDLTLESVDQVGDWFAQAEEPLQTLWRWHAAEESEHKSVAFDLYMALGGNHNWRMRWFNYVMVQFTLDTLRQTFNNLWHDRTLHRPSTWISGLRFLFGAHGLVRRAAAPLRSYRRKDFHPTQVGSAELATNWLNRNADRWTTVGKPAV